MMKALILAMLCAAPCLLAAQQEDTTAVNRQIDSLIRISRTLTGEEAFDRALEINAQAENLALEKLGRFSAGYGNCCFNHGRVLHLQGEYTEAEQWYLDGVAVFNGLPGEPDAGFGKCLNNLAYVYYATGDAGKLQALYQMLQPVREKTQNCAIPEFAACRHSLALFLEEYGYYEQAEPLYREALVIYRNAFGKESVQFAGCLNDMAALYVETGDYEDAESLYRETLEIREKVSGSEDADYALSLNNLANLYLDMGNFAQAEPLYRRARDILEKAVGREDPDYAICLDNLAALYLLTGRYEEGERLDREVLALREASLGKDHPDYALTLNHLALLYRYLGQYEQAEAHYRQALGIYEKAYGKRHRDYAMTLNNLGDAYAITGRYPQAEPVFREALEIVENTLGNKHPEYLAELQNLAELYLATGEGQQAARYFGQASELQRLLLTKAVRHLSERELGSYQARFEKAQAMQLSCAIQLPEASPLLAESCFDDALFHKGFLLYSLGRVRKLARANERSAAVFQQLLALERRLAAEHTRPLAEQQETAQLETRANDLEKTLVSSIAGLGQALQQVRWQEVQQKLRADEAAIEFVHFRYYDPKPTDSMLYAALLLRPGLPQPLLIPLFEEKALDSLLHTSGKRKADYVNSLYAIPERGVEPVGKPAQSLYALIWQPLEAHLTGIHTLYFSPTGLLHRINLGAIPVPAQEPSDEQTLADKYRLFQHGSTRQLALPADKPPLNREALLYGGVQYDLDTTAVVPRQPGGDDNVIASRSVPALEDQPLRSGNERWNYLSWTSREVEALTPLLNQSGYPATLRKDREATEESFKAIGRQHAAPRILHLATHGFFFPDPSTPERSDSGSSTGAAPIFKISEHPMVRSGLILCGGNYAWQNSKPFRPDMEDGILTAYEISQTNLSNTELVVLSACETGLGDIKGNEGVYGLQRAFKIAGARYLIMSLWQVPDFQTQELMNAFYTNWLEGKMTIPEAFGLAQKTMREKYRNPYFWAGFVLVE